MGVSVLLALSVYSDPIIIIKVFIEKHLKTFNEYIEFLIDSSGSVGMENWQQTVESIGQDWIEYVIVPLYGPFGNHVAARKFSIKDLSKRILDFQHKSFESSFSIDYAAFIGEIVRNIPYQDGDGTNTADALEKVFNEDLPSSRQILKHLKRDLKS